MKKITENIKVSIYVLLIVSTMLPSSKNSSQISNFKTIIPQIDKIYTSNANTENNAKYSFKILEILKDIF